MSLICFTSCFNNRNEEVVTSNELKMLAMYINIHWSNEGKLIKSLSSLTKEYPRLKTEIPSVTKSRYIYFSEKHLAEKSALVCYGDTDAICLYEAIPIKKGFRQIATNGIAVFTLSEVDFQKKLKAQLKKYQIKK